MRLANTSPIWLKPAGSSRLVRNENLNDHAAEEPCSQDRAEKFPAWAEIARVDRLSSHIMRHSFAAAVLSGTWGYEPKSFEFVGRQLGHADTQTTERYYGAFAPGVWLNEVRRMTGRREYSRRQPVTARGLLGLTNAAKDGEATYLTNSISGGVRDLVESSVESALPILAAEMPLFATIPSLTPSYRRMAGHGAPQSAGSTQDSQSALTLCIVCPVSSTLLPQGNSWHNSEESL